MIDIPDNETLQRLQERGVISEAERQSLLLVASKEVVIVGPSAVSGFRRTMDRIQAAVKEEEK